MARVITRGALQDCLVGGGGGEGQVLLDDGLSPVVTGLGKGRTLGREWAVETRG